MVMTQQVSVGYDGSGCRFGGHLVVFRPQLQLSTTTLPYQA